MTEVRSSSITIQLADDNGVGLFAEFWKQQDRYHHEFGIQIGQEKTVLLTSVEGSSQDFWPPCPPIQQVYKQNVDDNPVLLGVGMAGNRHYSTSVLLKPLNSSVELVVESACLIKEPPENNVQLEARYQSSQNWENSDGQVWCTRISDRPVFIEPITTTKLSIDSHSSTQIQFKASQIEIGNATQWGYRVVLG